MVRLLETAVLEVEIDVLGSMFSEIPSTDLVAQISRQITEAIVSGRLRPGERLTELQLSRQFGTSRAPVREAARLLESQGLVQSHPRRGFFVRTLTASDLHDIYELRIALEQRAAATVIECMPEGFLESLTRQIDRMFRLADSGSLEQQIFEDFAFHRLLCAGSGNNRLLRVCDEIATEMRAGITLIGRLYDDPHEIAKTHEPIVEALAARDAQRLREALERHIGTARDAVVALFETLEAQN